MDIPTKWVFIFIIFLTSCTNREPFSEKWWEEKAVSKYGQDTCFVVVLLSQNMCLTCRNKILSEISNLSDSNSLILLGLFGYGEASFQTVVLRYKLNHIPSYRFSSATTNQSLEKTGGLIYVKRGHDWDESIIYPRRLRRAMTKLAQGCRDE